MLDRPLPDLAATTDRLARLGNMRARLETAAQELTTGLQADLFVASGGDPARLAAIERGQRRTDADIDAFALAESRVVATQAALARVEEVSAAVGAPLLAATKLGDVAGARTYAAEARGAFEDAVGRLNAGVAGRSLFAGAAVDGAALAPASDILADLRADVAGAADGADLARRVADWFDDPFGGFAASAWRGEGQAPVARLGDGVETPISIRADAPETRAALAALALAAIAGEPGMVPNAASEVEALGVAAERAISARDGLVRVRADIGLAEARIEEAAIAARARRAALDAAWNDVTLRDPYEAATRFQELETGLQTAFAVAARLARLDFAAYLR